MAFEFLFFPRGVLKPRAIHCFQDRRKIPCIFLLVMGKSWWHFKGEAY
jgi:hypothetical protein